MLSTSTSYNLLTRDMARTLAVTASDPVISRETDYYLANISKVKSIDDFLANDRVFRYAMRAFGLEDMTYAKAFVRKILSEGIDEPGSFANTLTDRRYREFAETFNFVRYGETTTAFTRTQTGTTDRYLRQSVEISAGAGNEGVRLALYFERRAGGIDSIMDILADRALLTVTQTALGISPQTAALPIDKQASQLAERIDVEDFRTPELLNAFLNRFTTMWDIANPQAGEPVPTVLIGQPAPFGIDAGLLGSLQSLKTRGR